MCYDQKKEKESGFMSQSKMIKMIFFIFSSTSLLLTNLKASIYDSGGFQYSKNKYIGAETSVTWSYILQLNSMTK